MPSSDRQLVKNTSILSVGNIVQRLISLVVLYIMLDNLSLYDYGVFVLLFTIPGPIFTFLNLGLGKIIYTEVTLARGCRNYQRIKNILFSYYRLQWIILFITITVIFIFKNLILKNYEANIAELFYLIVAYIAITYFNGVADSLINSYERFIALSIKNIIEPLSRLTILVVLFYFLNSVSLISALIAYIASSLIGLILAVILMRSIIKELIFIKKQKNKDFIKILRGVGKWGILRSIVERITQDIIPWLIHIFITTEAVAIYNIAKKIVLMLPKAIPIRTIIKPLIIRNHKDSRLISLVILKAKKYYFLFALFIILVVYTSFDFIVINFIPKYIEVLPLIKIYVFILLVNAYNMGQSSILLAYRRQRFMAAMFVYGVIQKFTIFLILMYFFGLKGLIIGGLLHLAIQSIIRNIYISKKIGILKYKFKDFLRFDEYDRMLLNKFFKGFKRAKI